MSCISWIFLFLLSPPAFGFFFSFPAVLPPLRGRASSSSLWRLFQLEATSATNGNLLMEEEAEQQRQEQEAIQQVLSDAFRCVEVFMKDEERLLQDHPMLEMLLKKCKTWVEVKQSTIISAGNGLFATKKIPAGCIVAFYPIHAVEAYWKGVSLGCCSTNNDDEDREYFSTDPSADSYLLTLVGEERVFPGNVIFSQDFGETAIVSVNTNPHRRSSNNGCWWGHFINDCATVKEHTLEGVLEYYETVEERQNCFLVAFGPGPLCVAVTTKAVEAGEELFCSYGCSYWSPNVMMDDSSKEAKDIIMEQERIMGHKMVDTMNHIETKYAIESAALAAVFDKIYKEEKLLQQNDV